jgi:hypothetical protein
MSVTIWEASKTLSMFGRDQPPDLLEVAAPTMLFRPGIGMHPQKMMEHVEEDNDLVSVPVCLDRPDVIHNHIAHFLQAMS